MSDDRKKMATLIIAGMRKPSSAPEQREQEPQEGDEGSGYEAAAEEMLAALESKDAKQFSTALKSFVEMCQSESESYEESEE